MSNGMSCTWQISNINAFITGSTGPCSAVGTPIYIKFDAKCGGGGIQPCVSINREWWLTAINDNCGQTFEEGGESTCIELVGPKPCGVNAGTITDCISITTTTNGYYKLEYKLYGGGCPPASQNLLEDFIVYLERAAGYWSVVSNPCPP